MKDLRPIRGLHHLLELIEQGEHEHQDFKYLISDARKIARSVSAFANNDGGRLLIGVKDNGTIAGVRSEEDIFMIEQAAQRYCRPEVEVDFKAIKAGGNAVVFIATIPRAVSRPVQVVEEDGKLRAYFRVADNNVAAHPLMVAAWRYRGSDDYSLSIGEEECALLEHMRLSDRADGFTADELAIQCHMSRAMTNRSLTRLAAAGLIDFVHDGHSFLITLPSE